jgi:hypothetical protein
MNMSHCWQTTSQISTAFPLPNYRFPPTDDSNEPSNELREELIIQLRYLATCMEGTCGRRQRRGGRLARTETIQIDCLRNKGITDLMQWDQEIEKTYIKVSNICWECAAILEILSFRCCSQEVSAPTICTAFFSVSEPMVLAVVTSTADRCVRFCTAILSVNEIISLLRFRRSCGFGLALHCNC